MSVEEHIVERARSGDPDARQRVAQQLTEDPANNRHLLFELLGDRDWRVRKTVVEGFLRAPTEPIIAGLIQALHDSENAGRRNSATEALIRIGAPATAVILRELERERDTDVLLSFVNLLGDLRSDEAFAALISILDQETDLNLASSIVSSIGKYRRSSAIPALLAVLERDDLWLKFHVVEALGEIGDRSALPSILPLYAEKSLRKPVLEAIGEIADIGTVNFLLKIITEEDKLNLTALRALVRIADADKPRVVEAAERHLIQRKLRGVFPQEKVPPLIDHLRSTPKREVRSFILKVLGWSGDPTALGMLLEHLEQPETAEVAAQALIEFGPEAAPAVLDRLRTTDDDEVIALLLRVSNVIAGSEAIPTILLFLDHSNPLIRRFAAETLGEILDPSTVDYLLAKFGDPDVGCQQAAVNAISALVEAFPESKPETLKKIRKLLGSSLIPVKLNSLSVYVNIQGEGYPDELLLASKDGDPQIRQKAVSLMGRFSEQRFADQLVLSLADESPAVRVAAIQSLVRLRPESALTPLINSLQDPDIWIRTAAAQALGEYGDRSTIEPLVRQLREDLPPVKIATIEALGKLGDDSVKTILFDGADDPDMEIRRAALLALARLPGDDVLERLIRSVRSADWRERAAAAGALGARGDVRALDTLHQTLSEDRDPYVQQATVTALDRIGDASSFPHLFRALENPAILDEVSDVFVRHRDLYRPLLEQAWRTADSRHEMVIAAILQAMREDT